MVFLAFLLFLGSMFFYFKFIFSIILFSDKLNRIDASEAGYFLIYKNVNWFFLISSPYFIFSIFRKKINAGEHESVFLILKNARFYYWMALFLFALFFLFVVIIVENGRSSV